MLTTVLLWERSVSAHPDSSPQLVRLSSLIKATPGDASLYLARAGLLRDAGHFSRARQDYTRAAHLAPDASAALLGLATVELDSGRYSKALVVITKYLAHPDADARSDALLLRARAFARSGQGMLAAAAYREALASARRPRVQHYLEAARNVASYEGPASALTILARARAERGNVISFDLLRIELEVAAGRPHAALAIIDRWLGMAKRPERWYVRRAEVLTQMKLLTQARRAYLRAIAALEAMPMRRRRTRATRELEAAARKALTMLPTNRHDAPLIQKVSP